MADVCIVHLVWAPLGIPPLERFAASYLAHPAGTEHRLLLVFKEYRDPAALDAARAAVAGLGYDELHMPDSCLDLAAYVSVAEQRPEPWLFFCNSNSELLAGGWLATMLGHARRPGIGLVGATASYESFYSAAAPWEKPLRRLRFDPFPNPHVRTNGFLLSRELMLSLDWPKVRRKHSAWALESGRRSVTRQIAGRGLEPVVVGRDGAAYERDRWPESATFRSGDQSNLLVADNRTRRYDEAPPDERRMLAELAWGRTARR